jgi:hypothetical protein
MYKSKEEFLKSVFADNLICFSRDYDNIIEKLKKYNSTLEEQEEYTLWAFREHTRQAQWIVYSQALEYILGKEYFFKRGNDYFGIATKDEKDWLFKIKR